MVAVPTQVVEVGEGTLRAEPMTGEAVGVESFAAPCRYDREGRNGGWVDQKDDC